jgi:RNA polymerase sigma-70 factor (ECF subfamily)
MDEPARQFDALMERVRAGDQDAAREVYERYSDPVRRVVRRWLEERLRRQYDTADFVQSVWASFFQIPIESYTFDTPDALVAFLSRIAFHKVAGTRRKQTETQMRGDAKEVSLDAPARPTPGCPPLGQALPSTTHTPSQYVMADERWQGLINNLPPGHRRILELLREGHSHVEIADRLGIDRKVIQRVINRLLELDSPP